MTLIVAQRVSRTVVQWGLCSVGKQVEFTTDDGRTIQGHHAPEPPDRDHLLRVLRPLARQSVAAAAQRKAARVGELLGLPAAQDESPVRSGERPIARSR
jgi:hypothetical protein